MSTSSHHSNHNNINNITTQDLFKLAQQKEPSTNKFKEYLEISKQIKLQQKQQRLSFQNQLYQQKIQKTYQQQKSQKMLPQLLFKQKKSKKNKHYTHPSPPPQQKQQNQKQFSLDLDLQSLSFKQQHLKLDEKNKEIKEQQRKKNLKTTQNYFQYKKSTQTQLSDQSSNSIPQISTLNLEKSLQINLLQKQQQHTQNTDRSFNREQQFINLGFIKKGRCTDGGGASISSRKNSKIFITQQQQQKQSNKECKSSQNIIDYDTYFITSTKKAQFNQQQQQQLRNTNNSVITASCSPKNQTNNFNFMMMRSTQLSLPQQQQQNQQEFDNIQQPQQNYSNQKLLLNESSTSTQQQQQWYQDRRNLIHLQKRTLPQLKCLVSQDQNNIFFNRFQDRQEQQQQQQLQQNYQMLLNTSQESLSSRNHYYTQTQISNKNFNDISNISNNNNLNQLIQQQQQQQQLYKTQSRMATSIETPFRKSHQHQHNHSQQENSLHNRSCDTHQQQQKQQNNTQPNFSSQQINPMNNNQLKDQQQKKHLEKALGLKKLQQLSSHQQQQGEKFITSLNFQKVYRPKKQFNMTKQTSQSHLNTLSLEDEKFRKGEILKQEATQDVNYYKKIRYNPQYNLNDLTEYLMYTKIVEQDIQKSKLENQKIINNSENINQFSEDNPNKSQEESEEYRLNSNRSIALTVTHVDNNNNNQIIKDFVQEETPSSSKNNLNQNILQASTDCSPENNANDQYLSIRKSLKNQRDQGYIRNKNFTEAHKLKQQQQSLFHSTEDEPQYQEQQQQPHQNIFLEAIRQIKQKKKLKQQQENNNIRSTTISEFLENNNQQQQTEQESMMGITKDQAVATILRLKTVSRHTQYLNKSQEQSPQQNQNQLRKRQLTQIPSLNSQTSSNNNNNNINNGEIRLKNVTNVFKFKKNITDELVRKKAATRIDTIFNIQRKSSVTRDKNFTQIPYRNSTKFIFAKFLERIISSEGFKRPRKPTTSINNNNNKMQQSVPLYKNKDNLLQDLPDIVNKITQSVKQQFFSKNGIWHAVKIKKFTPLMDQFLRQYALEPQQENSDQDNLLQHKVGKDIVEYSLVALEQQLKNKIYFKDYIEDLLRKLNQVKHLICEGSILQELGGASLLYQIILDVAEGVQIFFERETLKQAFKDQSYLLRFHKFLCELLGEEKFDIYKPNQNHQDKQLIQEQQQEQNSQDFEKQQNRKEREFKELKNKVKKMHEDLNITFEEFYIIKYLFYESLKERKIYEPAIYKFLEELERIRYIVQNIQHIDLFFQDRKQMQRNIEKLKWYLDQDKIVQGKLKPNQNSHQAKQQQDLMQGLTESIIISVMYRLNPPRSPESFIEDIRLDDNQIDQISYYVCKISYDINIDEIFTEDIRIRMNTLKQRCSKQEVNINKKLGGVLRIQNILKQLVDNIDKFSFVKNYLKDSQEELCNISYDIINPRIKRSGLNMLEFFFICKFSDLNLYSRYDLNGGITSFNISRDTCVQWEILLKSILNQDSHVQKNLKIQIMKGFQEEFYSIYHKEILQRNKFMDDLLQ